MRNERERVSIHQHFLPSNVLCIDIALSCFCDLHLILRKLNIITQNLLDELKTYICTPAANRLAKNKCSYHTDRKRDSALRQQQLDSFFVVLALKRAFISFSALQNSLCFNFIFQSFVRSFGRFYHLSPLFFNAFIECNLHTRKSGILANVRVSLH